LGVVVEASRLGESLPLGFGVLRKEEEKTQVVRMAPKKDPNAPIVVHDDACVRTKRILDLKIAPKPPKGDLTVDDTSVPPAFHNDAVLKPNVEYWLKAGVVRYADRKSAQPPSTLTPRPATSGGCKAEDNLKQRPRKEVQDLMKALKKLVTQAEKRTGLFLKQLEKNEAKVMKREALRIKIEDLDKAMNDELRRLRRFAAEQKIFSPEFVQGSKFGDKAPRKNVLICCELSERQSKWMDEVKDEVTKFVNGTINPQVDAFNIGILTDSGMECWMGAYQSPKDAKKGSGDALKWLGKNLNPKFCAGRGDPDWTHLLAHAGICDEQGSILAPGAAGETASTVFFAISRPPSGNTAKKILATVQEHRQASKTGYGVPFRLIGFDPAILEDESMQQFLAEMGGPKGKYMVDTSQDDLQKIDQYLNSVKAKRKQLEKLNKQFEKLEDLSGKLDSDRKLLSQQIFMEKMLRNDLDLMDHALKTELVLPGAQDEKRPETAA